MCGTLDSKGLSTLIKEGCSLLLQCYSRMEKLNPLMRDYLHLSSMYGQNFDFKKEAIIEKNSYERCAYKSVDGRSLYILGYISIINRRQNLDTNGLIT